MNASIDCIHQTFIAGSQLQARWQGKDSFAILATDFGDGLAFLYAWNTWQQDAQRSQRLHYLVFANPKAPALQVIPPELQPLFDELIAHWPLAIDGFHRIYLQQGQVMQQGQSPPQSQIVLNAEQVKKAQQRALEQAALNQYYAEQLTQYPVQ